MGLILDTSILISSERNGEAVEDLLSRCVEELGEDRVAISTVTVVEFTHGIYRTKDGVLRSRRRTYAEDAFEAMTVFPLSYEIARLAGEIDGEEAAVGNTLPFEDLIIGATAIYFGFSVVTHNTRHFRRIPGLNVVSV